MMEIAPARRTVRLHLRLRMPNDSANLDSANMDIEHQSGHPVQSEINP